MNTNNETTSPFSHKLLHKLEFSEHTQVTYYVTV